MADACDPAVLAEQWYSLHHETLAGLQAICRNDPLAFERIALRLDRTTGAVERRIRGQMEVTLCEMHEFARALGYRLDVSLTKL